jgi:hypothetical protein
MPIVHLSTAGCQFCRKGIHMLADVLRCVAVDCAGMPWQRTRRRLRMHQTTRLLCRELTSAGAVWRGWVCKGSAPRVMGAGQWLLCVALGRCL